MMKFKLLFISLFILFAVVGIQSQTYNKNLEGNIEMIKSNNVKYGQFGKLKSLPGKGDELLSIMLDAARVVADVKGCRMYIVSKDRNDENIIWVFEVWDTEEDHRNSLQLEKVRELISRAIPLIDREPDSGIVLDVIGGAGLDENTAH